MLTPAYKLIIGDRIVDTTDEPQASLVTQLTVSLDMDRPADRLELVTGQVGSWRPALDDEATVELGYAGEEGLTRVLSGSVKILASALAVRRVTVFSRADSLLHAFSEQTFEAKTSGEILRDLADQAGVNVANAEDGISFPAYVIDGRRSFWHHLRDLADLCGFDLYFNSDGELVFERFTGGRTTHLFDHGQHVIALELNQAPPSAATVEAWGESPTGFQGEDAWGWLTKDFSGSKGSAGSGAPTRLLERPGRRTRQAAQTAAAALHTDLQRRVVRGQLVVFGNPEVQLGDSIRLRNLPEEEQNGAFQVRAVTHRISKAEGFTTTIGLRGIQTAGG